MRISKEKRDKISEQILAELYAVFPNSLFTAQIARNLARDEEFIKSLLKELWQKNLVVAIKKNSKGVAFSKRIRWRIGNKAYGVYKLHQ